VGLEDKQNFNTKEIWDHIKGGQFDFFIIQTEVLFHLKTKIEQILYQDQAITTKVHIHIQKTMELAF
jgi:hypothetical protein